jgi:hypothetical protein
MLHRTFFKIINIYDIGGPSYCDIAIPWLVAAWIRCEFYNILNIC